MTGRFSARHPGTRFLVLAAILFVALRALVPQGYMVARSQSGGPVIEICTGQGMQVVTLDPTTGQARIAAAAMPGPHAPGDTTPHAADPCPFAVAVVGAFYSSPVLPTPPASFSAPAYILMPAAFAAGIQAPLPPARGPPLSA